MSAINGARRTGYYREGSFLFHDGVPVVEISGHRPGDRRSSSTTTDYKRAFPTGTPTRYDGVNGSETLHSATPVVVQRVIPNNAHDGTITLRNAATTGGGGTPVFVLDLSPGEEAVLFAEFDTGLTVDGNNAASDFTVVTAPL